MPPKAPTRTTTAGGSPGSGPAPFIMDEDDDDPLIYWQQEAERAASPLPTSSLGSAAKLRAWRDAEKSARRGRARWPLDDADMEKAFPDVAGSRSKSLTRETTSSTDLHPGRVHRGRPTQHKSGQDQYAAYQTEREKKKTKKRTIAREHGVPKSDMGFFALLPGELRNVIYRLAFVDTDAPTLIVAPSCACGLGGCVHTKLPFVAPGMASTCRQVRAELLPMFCSENVFEFDEAMVRQRCAANWLKTLGPNARLIPKIILQLIIRARNAGVSDKLGEVTIETPAARQDGRFEVSLTTITPALYKETGLEFLCKKLNQDVRDLGRASKLAFLLRSDELADLVYRCRKMAA